MDPRNSALGDVLRAAHEEALKKAEQHCHFKEHARKAVKAYLTSMAETLEGQGFDLAMFKIRDEQDNKS